MLVERLCRYFNKGLTIMCNEQDTVHVALESLLLLLYAWNSCPVPGTDISRSLVAVGQEFSFPIDFSSSKHWQLMSSPATVDTYSKQLATQLSACPKVVELLAREQRKWHRALFNSQRKDPRVYSPGEIVFARCATQSVTLFVDYWKIRVQVHGALASDGIIAWRLIIYWALP